MPPSEDRCVRLNLIADRISTEVMDMWWEHSRNGTTPCVLEVSNSLQMLAQVNREYRGLPILDWLLDRLVIDENAACHVADALYWMGDRAANDRVVAALVNMVRAGGDDARRAAYSLGEMGVVVGTVNVVLALLEMVHSGGIGAWRAARALLQIADKAAIDEVVAALLEAVRTGGEDARWAANILVAIGEQPATEVTAEVSIDKAMHNVDSTWSAVWPSSEIVKNVPTADLVYPVLEMINIGGLESMHAVPLIVNWHQANIRLFSRRKMSTALHVLQLTRGQRTMAEAQPTEGDKLELTFEEFRIWTCDCNPHPEYSLPAASSMNGICPTCQRAYKLQ